MATVGQPHQEFAALLDRAVAHGEATPPETALDPAVLAAIDDVARAWPRVPVQLIAKARNTFVRCERTRTSATSPTHPLDINRRRPRGTGR